MLTTTTTPQPDQAPTFDHQEPGEAWPEYGRRVVRYLLTHGQDAAWRLSDQAIEAGADGARVAATGCPRDQAKLAGILADLERFCRRRLVTRQDYRDATLAAWLAAAGVDQVDVAQDAPVQAPSVPQAPPAQGGKPGGGSRVPRTPRPGSRPGGGVAIAMDETGAGAFTLPPALAALRPVAPLAANTDDLF